MVAWLGPALAAGASLLGTFLGNRQREEGQSKEMAAQKEFAQHGLRWRVEDAKAAGIHPVYALGFNGPTYSPVGLGQNDTAAGFSDAGQSIGRAIDATRTEQERQSVRAQMTERLGVERMQLENDLLRAQIASYSRSAPAFPVAGPSGQFIDGQGNVVLRTPFGLGSTTVSNPNLADESQRHFGELGEWIYGGGNMLESWVSSLGRSAMDAIFDDSRPRQKYIEILVPGGVK